MRKLIAIMALVAAASNAAALDQKALRGAIDASLYLWDAAVPYVRLGSAPALRVLDPAGVLRDLAADFTAAGRWDEFSYLVEYAEQERKAGRLEIRMIADRPPTPGFWPARESMKKRAIVISEFDAEFLREEPALYRSSFIRAIATLYYIDKEASLNALLLGRNALNEFAGFMSGIWTESIYLREIRKVTAPVGPSPDYYNLLLGSARDDNLKSAGAMIFGVDMGLAYDAIRDLRGVKKTDDAKKLLQDVSVLPGSLLADARRAAFGSPPSPYLLDRCLSIRSALITLPWVHLSVSRAMPRGDASLDPLMDSTLSGLAALEAVYSYADGDYLEGRVMRISELLMRPPEPDAPQARSGIAPPADASTPYPGAASASWYRFCLPRHAFLPEGILPIDPAAAKTGAAFRFSRDGAGRLLAIEYFVHGKPRQASELLQAARVSVSYDDSIETWRYENQLGQPIVNELGWSVMITAISPDAHTKDLSFYAKDGRRVADSSGAWGVSVKDDGSSLLVLTYRDLGGRPYAGSLGYAVDERTYGQNKDQQRRFLDERGGNAVARGTGYHRAELIIGESPAGIRFGFAFFGPDGEPAPFLSSYAKETVELSADGRTVEFMDADGRPVSGELGFSRELITMRDGLPVAIDYFGPDGAKAFSADGYSSLVGQLDDLGNQVEAAMFGADGSAIANAEGYHRRVAEFDGNGMMVQIRFFGVDGQPANNETGASRIRWSLGPDGSPYWADAWDRNGILLTGNQPGEL